MHKDTRKVINEAIRQGFDTRDAGSGHLVISRDGVTVCVVSGTPSDQRALRNTIASLRRAGMVWPPTR